MPSLIIERGPERGQIIELPADSRFVIGRDEGTEIQISDAACSRRHCGLIERDGTILVKDLGSTHGTYVNGKQIQKKRLKDGDVITIGETLFSFMAESRDAGLVGRVVAGYKIHGRIGRGGMGTVYRGHQVALDREVALKVLSGRYSDDTVFINRFFKEAQAAARLNHPNVVQVYDVREEKGLYFISLEMMDRGTVQDLATEQGQLPISRVLEIARDAARGLIYAERQKIVHGDIKPDNLMINSDGHIKISDLGLARDAGELSSQGEEGIFGTPHFISPEQALGKRVDTRSDIYSLGATLYRLIGGTTPHDGASVQEIVLKQINETPKDLTELRPECPRDLRDLVSVMMAKEPEDRFENAQELLNALEALGDSGRLRSAASLAAPAIIVVIAIVAAASTWWLLRDDTVKPEDSGKSGETPTVVKNGSSAEEAANLLEEAELAAKKKRLQAKTFLIAANTRKLEIKQQGNEENIKALEELIGLFERVVETAPECPDATLAKTQINQLKAAIAGIQQARTEAELAAQAAHRVAEETYLLLDSEIKAAVAKDGFAPALAKLMEGRETLSSSHRSDDLRLLSAFIMSKARERSDSLHGSADRCVIAGDFDGARESIRIIIKQFNPKRRRDGVFAELESLVKLAEAQLSTIDVSEQRQRILDLDTDQKMAFAALKKLYTTIKDGVPTTAASRDVAHVQASLKTTAYKARLAGVLQDLLAVNSLREHIAEKLKGDAPPSLRIYGVRGLPAGRLIAADAKTVTIEQRNKSTKVINWSSIDSETAVRQIFRKAAESPADKVLLIHACLLLGQLEQAEDTMAELLANATTAEDLAPLKTRLEAEVRASNLLSRIHELEKKTAEDKMAWFELNDALEIFLDTCRGTRAFILVSDGSTMLVSGQ